MTFNIQVSNIQGPIGALGSDRKHQGLHVLQVDLGDHPVQGFQLCLGLLLVLGRPSLLRKEVLKTDPI